jgi:SAM-dependent methyltransferase
MLARARTRVPQADFRPGDLQDLPLADDSADIIVCGLALNHVPALQPVMAEFARVLRPGGHLVISVGLQVQRCEEPRLPADPPRSAASFGVAPWERWPWSLAGLVPDAAHAVNAGRPVTIVWHFQLAE